MKTNFQRFTVRSTEGRRAFTLIEILVVLAIIGILAGIIVNLSTGASEKKVRARAEVLLEDLALAIDGYKDEMGFYPPSHPTDVTRPPLYYSLTGEGDTLSQAEVQAAFGMDGFVNSANGRGRKNFLSHLKREHIQEENGVKYIGFPYEGPEGSFNPVRYDAASPNRQNRSSYDLWVEVVIGGQTNFITNWE